MVGMQPKPDLRAECIRLRVEERLSLKAIHMATRASIGSLSAWLKPFPLTAEERADRARRQERRTGPRVPLGAESNLSETVRRHRLTSQQVAKVSETAVLLRLLTHGLSPFGSVFDGDRTDWLVETPSGRVWKVQVKTAIRGRHGRPAVTLRRAQGSRRYIAGEFDFIVGFDVFSDRAYVWSWAETQHLTCSVSCLEEACERWDKLMFDPGGVYEPACSSSLGARVR